jgi:hypothetical protein
VRYLTLAEALTIAEAVTGLDQPTLAKSSRLELLDPAMSSYERGTRRPSLDVLDRLVNAAGSRLEVRLAGRQPTGAQRMSADERATHELDETPTLRFRVDKGT